MTTTLQSSLQTSAQPEPYRPRKDYRKTHPFLTPLLLKTIRITTRDNRIFVGSFKCTDRDCNIILGPTHEYRVEGGQSATGKKVDLSSLGRSRFLGLVCVPGGEVVKIELEEEGEHTE
ncbi:hypothetical protein BJ508DRAFT_412085 [Ascobolus immersus RN42]|uniref:Sm domain-containing protein n=1 Tax=Ascobolus immersus RN42 TaxID=1160509 RepID=A0A3N4IGN0_ASCIM|nr:hypothetical protein BJ508DRAFT_412085 [Ascobolus immersus RN42]